MAKSLVEQDPVGTQKSGEDVALDWRIDRYMELGFEHVDAVALANSTQSSTTNKNGKTLVWHVPLNWARVKKAVEAGCSRAQVVDIFVNAEAA